jgi:type II secretory pathway component PulF
MPLEFDTPDSDAAPAASSGLAALFAARRQRVSDKDRQFFTEQLSMLLDTGTSLHGALQTLAKQAENPALSRLIDDLVADIGEGRSFAQALARHPEVFSRSYVALVAASESGGFLHKVLEQLQQLEENRVALRDTVFSALSYPAFLVLFSLGVVVFVLVVVFPKFADMFVRIHDQLPIVTRVLMAASELLTQHWYLLLPGVAALLALAVHAWRSPGGRARTANWKLRLPVLRDIFVPFYFTQILRVMSLSLANGVSLMEALAACREVVDNSEFRAFLARVEQRIQQGAGIAAGFEQESFVPKIVRQMISTGEATGNLARVMGRIADHYERELTRKVATVARMAEPLMLMVMGGVVGLIVSSLILPIFQLSRTVN